MNLTATGSASNISVSAAFMNHMGLVSLYNAAEVRGEIVTKVKAQNPDGEAYLPFIVGGSIFVLVAAFVFAAGGILLIIRFGVLLILMILSPIAFAAQVFPKVAGWSKMWWDKLFAQAFFAPAYFFMIYVTLKVATSYQTSMRGFDNIYSAQSQVFVRGFETAAYFALTIVLMIASIIVAKQMGAVGAARMGAIGKWTARQTTGFMGRNTLGRFADWRAQRREEVGKPSTSTMSRIYSSMAKSTYGGSLSRPQIREAGEKAAVKKARYDQTRKVSAAIAANVSAAPGSSQQEVLEGTISGATTEQLHDMLKGKSPGNAQYDAIVRNMSASQFDSLMKLKPEEMDDGAKAELKKARGRAIQTTLQNNARAAATAANAPIPATQQGDESALRQGISKASTAQLEVLGVDVLEKNALSLSSSQMDDIKKSTKFTESQVARIRTARENALVTEYQSNPTAIFARKEAEIAKLPVKILEDGGATPYFTGEVLRRMQDDGDVLPAVRAKIKANILNLATAVPPGTQGGPTQSAFDYLTANPRGKNF